MPELLDPSRSSKASDKGPQRRSWPLASRWQTAFERGQFFPEREKKSGPHGRFMKGNWYFEVNGLILQRPYLLPFEHVTFWVRTMGFTHPNAFHAVLRSVLNWGQGNALGEN